MEATTRRPGLALVWLLLAVAWMPHAWSANAGGPGLEVVDRGWGGGETTEIAKVITAVIEEFPNPAAGMPPSMRIRHRFGGPMIDYRRDRDGRLVVYLSARDDRWYQYVYQFAHEYCHVLSNFQRKLAGDEILRDHQWFEESVCETASLFALQRLSTKWCGNANDARLRAAAPELAQYLHQLLAEPHRRLDPGTDMAAWYSRYQEALRANPYLREMNELAATQLLPLFVRHPEGWAALGYLNPSQPSPGQTFAGFLAAWRAASPTELAPIVDEFQALFGLGPASAPAAPRSPPRPLSGTSPGCGS